MLIPACEPLLLNSAEYLLSAHNFKDLVEDKGSEIAFAGRSNVGKSSAINAITGKKSLARTSKTPGRTQQIIFFQLDAYYRLVDLPGYGFAKVPVSLQQHWGKLLQDYFEKRISLKALVLPIDCRREPTDLDWQLINWCTSTELPVHVLLTKSDKFGRGKRIDALRKAEKYFSHMQLVSVQLFSSKDSTGVSIAREKICTLLAQSRNK